MKIWFFIKFERKCIIVGEVKRRQFVIFPDLVFKVCDVHTVRRSTNNYQRPPGLKYKEKSLEMQTCMVTKSTTDQQFVLIGRHVLTRSVLWGHVFYNPQKEHLVHINSLHKGISENTIILYNSYESDHLPQDKDRSPCISHHQTASQLSSVS